MKTPAKTKVTKITSFFLKKSRSREAQRCGGGKRTSSYEG